MKFKLDFPLFACKICYMYGLKLAHDITRKNGKTFYFASLFLRKQKRVAAYTIYAICRISDDSVDKNQGIAASDNLSRLQNRISSVYLKHQITDPLLLAFAKTVEKYQIPRDYFDILISGMQMDLTKTRYQNFSELYDYSFKVAGVVGLIMLRIFGYTNQHAQDHAVKLGIAMQLTNILRDIKEDYQRGRIYLPADEMQRFAITEDDINNCLVSENFKAFMQFQIQRARGYYEKAAPGIKMLTDLNSRFVAQTMSKVYSGILDEIEKNSYDIFSKRARVNSFNKIITLLKNLPLIRLC